MMPSEALLDLQAAERAAAKDLRCNGYMDAEARGVLRRASEAFDQAIYDMARRAHLGLPMVDEPRKKRGRVIPPSSTLAQHTNLPTTGDLP